MLRSARLADLGVGLTWLFLVCAGLGWVWGYATTGGAKKTTPHVWPAECQTPRSAGRPTLLVFLHPRCPCSRATLGELALIMAKAQGHVSVQAWFYRPEGSAEEWARTDLWRSAEAIPGVQVADDEGGREAACFQAAVSGQTLLYSAAGRRLFDGGITGARGHAGDNAGRAAVMAALLSGEAFSATETPVFGCALSGQESPSTR